MNYDSLRESIIMTHQIAKSRNWYIKFDSIIGDKANEEEIENLELSIGKKLPSQLRDLLMKMSKSVNLYYQIEEDIPSEFGQIFSGGIWFDLDLIENSTKELPEWFEASLDEEINDIESIKITRKLSKRKSVLFDVGNGDLIVIDDETNEVIYLGHEGDTMHGKSLGKDLNSFLDQWSKMGFFGIEGWQLEEMYDFEKNKLKDINDKKVSSWINWLNKTS